LIEVIMFAILGDAANAYNAIPWEDAIPFTLILIGLYWVKVKIDTRAGLGKKKSRELKKIIVDAIVEGHRQAHKKD
tara:strand:+ start:1103 stop:1330 length:228 start_codon:yes stop_codon:yes gene_type:complete